MCSRARVLRSRTSSRRWASITDRCEIPRGPPVGDQRARAIAPGSSRRGCGRAPGSAASACSARPSRRSSSAARSQAWTWRWFSVSSTARPRLTRPRNAPPASSSGSWRWSPTSTSLPPTAAAASMSCASCRVGTMPASSTTSTQRSGSARGASRRSPSRAATLVLRMPGVVFELARGASGDRHAEHREPGGLPCLAGGGERERLARPRLADHHAHPVAVRGRAARPSVAARLRASAAHATAARTAFSRATPAPVVLRGADLADEPLLEREQLRRRVDELVALDRQQPPVARRYASPSPCAGSSATACGEARNRSVAASIARASTSAPAGSALAQRLEDVAARERRRALREPGRRGELGEDPLPHRIVERRGAGRGRAAARACRGRGRARLRGPASPRPARRS